MTKYSEEFKTAVCEEAARQGKDIDPDEIGVALDLLTGDICVEYMNEVKRNVAVELDKVRAAEDQVQRKQKELDDLYDEIKTVLDECRNTQVIQDAAPESGRYLPSEMQAISNLFTIMTDNAISRGVSPDLAVSKVSYMLNAYLGSAAPPEEIADDIVEYRNPDMEVVQDENPDVDLPWDTTSRQTYPGNNKGGGNNRGNNKRKHR